MSNSILREFSGVSLVKEKVEPDSTRSCFRSVSAQNEGTFGMIAFGLPGLLVTDIASLFLRHRDVPGF